MNSALRDFPYFPKRWMKAEEAYVYGSHILDPGLYGFHVYVDRRSCERYFSNYYNGLILIKVEVKELLASGKFTGMKSETWKYMRVIKRFKCLKVKGKLTVKPI